MRISPERFQRFVYVHDVNGERCQKVTAVMAAGWCTEGKALRTGRSSIRLTGFMEFHPCRTRTGRSYTYQEPTQVAVDQLRFGLVPIQPSGRTVLMHKSIAFEDRGYFVQAITDNLVYK